MSTPEAEPQSPQQRLQKLLCLVRQEWFEDSEGSHPAEITLGEITKTHPEDRENEAWGRIVYATNNSGTLTYSPPYQTPDSITSYQFKFSASTAHLTEVKEWLNPVGLTERLEVPISHLDTQHDVLSEISGFVQWALDDYEVAASVISKDEGIPDEPNGLDALARRRPAKYLLGLMQPGIRFKSLKRF